MKALLSFLIIILAINLSIAQNSKFPLGIYETKESILLKQPTRIDSLEISERGFFSGSDRNLFELKSYTKSIKQKDIKKSFYGYSDGKNMYLNGYKFGIYYNYMPVIYEGSRFIVFMGIMSRFGSAKTIIVFMGIMSRFGSDLYHVQKKLIPYLTVNDTSPRRSWGVNPVGFAFGGLIGGVLYSGPQNNVQFLYALDTKTEEIHTMSIETMQKLLDAHNDLLSEFNGIPNRHSYEVYLKYMKLLDSKN
jgi:hypothetical protein